MCKPTKYEDIQNHNARNQLNPLLDFVKTKTCTRKLINSEKKGKGKDKKRERKKGIGKGKKRKGKKKHRKAQNKRQKRQKKSQIIRSLWGVAIIQRLIFPVDGEDVDPVDVDDVENVSCFFEGQPPPDCVSSLAQEMFGHKQTYVYIIYNILIYI